MRINVQSCQGMSKGESFLQDIAAMVECDLSRFGGRITSVDVLLIEESDTAPDKGCVIEAQFADHEPVAVRAHAGTLEHAVSAGTEKMRSVIDHTPEPIGPIDESGVGQKSGW